MEEEEEEEEASIELWLGVRIEEQVGLKSKRWDDEIEG
jgi:hypothetical protein